MTDSPRQEENEAKYEMKGKDKSEEEVGYSDEAEDRIEIKYWMFYYY